jgi:hypothetical protein
MTECFQIDRADNVATLLGDAEEAAEVAVRGDGSGTVRATQSIRSGHKIAVLPIATGERIIKYGFPIGEATQPIAQGEWVHLHNCRSLYDARSSTLDIDSGSPTETRYV